MDAFIAFSDFVERQPPWLRPVLWGSGLVVGMFFWRLGGPVGAVVITVALTITVGLKVLVALPAALLVTAVAGAAGGLAYSLLAPLRALGFPGRWTAWVVATATYLSIALALLSLDSSFEVRLTDPAARWALAICAVIFGTFGAFQFREPETDPVHLPTGPGIVRVAVEMDLRRLESQQSPDSRAALLAIRSRTPSPEYAAHWQRVLQAIDSQPGTFAPDAKRAALAIAHEQLAAAQSGDVDQPCRRGA